MGAGKSRLQMSESGLYIISAIIAGHIAPTENYTPLTITSIRLTFPTNYPFSVLQKVTKTTLGT